jgi:hypothetical protein
MNDKLDDVWQTRDFPVLREVVRLLDAGSDAVWSYELTDVLGMDDATIVRSFAALQRRGLVEVLLRGGDPDGVREVAGQAYILTGLHPNGDDLRERLVSLLEQIAEQTDDPEEQTNTRKAARQLGILSRDTFAGVASALAASGIVG